MTTINVTATGTNDGTAINTAISGASSGDIILLADGTYDINTTVLLAAGLTLEGSSESGTKLVANGLTTNSVIYANNVDGTTVKKLTVDGNSEADTGGVQFRQSDNHSISNVTIKNTGGHQLMFYGCDGCSVDDITTSSVTGLTGTSHGFDIDEHSTGSIPTTNLTVTNSYFENGEGTRDAFKAENCTGVTISNCTFETGVILSDAVSTNCGVSFSSCTFDCVVKVNQTDATEEPSITNSTFTRDGGCIMATSATGNNLDVTNSTFLGRNKFIGFNGTTWISVPATITESGNTHPGISDNGGRTVFASLVSTGKVYNKAPYITPDTARSSLEALIEDANLDETNIRYALVSDRGTHTASGSDSSISPPASITGATIEGYPGVATYNMAAQAADFINTGNLTGTLLKDIIFTSGDGAGDQVFRVTAGTHTLENVTIKDCTGVTSPLIEFRDGATVTLRSCTLKDNAGSGNGILVGSAGTAATVNLEGCKVYDNTTTGDSIVRVLSTTIAHNASIKGCEFVRNTSGAAGTVYLDTLAGTFTVDNNTFVGNTGSTADDVVTNETMTMNNNIHEASTDLGGTGTITVANCLINGGIGALTDGGNNINGSPTYTDSSSDDYTLTSASSGVGTGKAGNDNFIGANGEPFANFARDIGANMSTHGPFHPLNL